MKNKTVNKILSLALAAAMLLGMCASGPAVATAYAVEMGAGDSLANPDGSGSSTEYQTVYFGEYNGSPIPWRVLDNDVNSDGTQALLLSEQSLTSMAYKPVTNVWKDSTIREYLNNDTTGLFAELPSVLQSVIAETDTTVGANATTDKLYLLSADEANALNSSDRNFSGLWLLRSPGSNNYSTAYVTGSGTVNTTGINVGDARAIRSAFRIPMDSNIFASGGSGSDSDPWIVGGTEPKTLALDNYVQFEIGSNDYKWKVIKTDGGYATLLCTSSLGSKPFDANMNNVWETSDIRAFLNPTTEWAYNTNTFSFGNGEKAAIAQADITVTGQQQTTDRLFLLSQAQAEASAYFPKGDTDRRLSGDRWWLRSPGDSDLVAAFVSISGSVDATGGFVYLTRAIRPAFNLNLSSVIFTSAAEGGKSDATVGSGLVVASTTTGAVKLTVLDSSLTLASVTCTGVTGNTVNFNYTGATTGKALSAVVLDQNGNVKYYGKLADNTTENGTASVTLPDDLADTDTVQIFVEEANDDYYTDYASAFMKLDIPDLEGTVSITGTADYGETLTADTTGITSSSPLGTLTHQWKRGGTDISGANNSTYTLTADDIGQTVTVTVSAANYRNSLTSSGVTVSKANPAYTLPEDLTATYGDTLASVPLPSGWTWESTGLVGGAGDQTHKATFTPANTDVYNVLSNLDVTVTVTPKTLYASIIPVSESINAGEALPGFSIRYSGFVTGENADNIAGFTAPSIGGMPADSLTSGAYTLTLSSGDTGGNYTFDYTDATATLYIGSVSVGDDDYTLSGTAGTDDWYKSNVTVTPANGYDRISIDGVNWAESLTVSDEGGNVSCTFYLKKTSTGGFTESKTIYLKIDKAAPEGEIEIKTNSFKSFLNTITFGLFFKNTVDVEITGEDATSGVASIEYQKVASESEYDPNGEWTSGDNCSVTANETFIVYAKITDNAGNVTIINSNGVVIYTDSAQDTESITYTKTSGENKEATVTLNGNTVVGIQNGADPLTESTDYTVASDGTITFNAAYLETLAAENYTLTISYNPMGLNYVAGENNEAPAATSIALTVEKAEVAPAVSVAPGSQSRPNSVTLSATGFPAGATGTLQFKANGTNIGEPVQIGQTVSFTASGSVNNYIFTVEYSGDGNYKSATSGDTAFTFDKGIQNTLTIDTVADKTYGDAAFDLSTTGGSGTGTVSYTVTSGDDVISISGNTVTILKAGTATVTATKAADNDYNETTSVAISITVDKRAITVTADNKEKYVGAADPALTWTADGLVSGDTLTGGLKYTGSAVGSYDIVEDTPFADPNYDITFVKGTMTIKRTLTMDEVIDVINNLPGPDDIDNNDKDFADKVADATNDFDALSDDEKAQIPDDLKDKLKDAQDKAGEINIKDEDVALAAPDLPWYIRIVATPISESDSRYATFFNKLTDKKLLVLYDIKLIDTLTGEDYTLPTGETVTVELSGVDLTGTKSIVIAHEKADGTIEYITATVEDGKVTFTASSFSLFGVTAAADKKPEPTDPTVPGTGDNSNPAFWLLLGGASLTVLGGMIISERKRKRYRVKTR